MEKARFSRMNGYGSHRRVMTTTLMKIQMATMTVWMTRKRAVPRLRAMASLNSPKASGS